MKNSIKETKFIVGTISPTGQISMAQVYPRIHATEAEARREVERLAKGNPSKTFIYFESKGMCTYGDVVWDE